MSDYADSHLLIVTHGKTKGIPNVVKFVNWEWFF